jgi:signal transduction histidine kinase
MQGVYDFPIRRKLLSLFLLSSGVVLLLAMIAIVVYDSFDYKRQKVSDLAAQAEILGKTSIAALTFNDAKAATEYLAALKAKPTIVAAALYGADGKLFANFSRDGASLTFPQAGPPGHHVHGGDVELFHRIEQNKETIGTVYLRANLLQLTRMISYASIVFLVMGISLCIGLWISAKLQSVISKPILEIAAVARAVINKKDYTLRANKLNDDEIGFLTVAFNQMLTHIEERDARLLAINQSLQEEIEERTHAQEALKKNIEELARSNAELEQFAYVSSHDLQEPLRMVASYTQLLEKRYGDKFDSKGELFLHYIVDGAKRMQQLIDDLLTFSRVGAHHQSLRPVSSQGALDVALLNLKHAIDESGAQIKRENLPKVIGDTTQLAQLFQNLISNAIKFRGDKVPFIEIDAKKKNSFWLFMVRDNGIGIDADHFDRIFLVFQRLHGRGEYPGSGIGLAICKKIVELHGGQIWVESKVGHGSAFCFTLRGAQ